MAKAKKPVKKAATKPKTMSARRTPVTPQTVGAAIVGAVLDTRKKTFTSTDIAVVSEASPRHSRRLLTALAKKRILKVSKKTTPFEYAVTNRTKLRQFVATVS